MRILLVATNRQDRMNSRMNAQPMPIGLAYIAAHLDHERHEVKVVDLMFADDYLAEIERVVKDFRPHVVGVSLRNLSNHSYLNTEWALPITRDVIARIREHSEAAIIVGGPAFSLLPKQCYEFLKPDLGVAGDAGETFAEVCERIEIGERSVYDLPGVVYGKDGEVVLNEGLCVSAFATRPRLEDLEMDKYRNAGFGVGVLTKLGSFSYPTPASTAGMSEADYRVIRPIDEVVAEVRELWEKYRLRKVFFVDNGFNCPLDHAKSLCSAIIEADLGIRWNTPLASFNCDTELVRLMRKPAAHWCCWATGPATEARERSGWRASWRCRGCWRRAACTTPSRAPSESRAKRASRWNTSWTSCGKSIRRWPTCGSASASCPAPTWRRWP